MTTTFILYLLIVPIVQIVLVSCITVDWDYQDQENWGELHPECKMDRDQSPINIVKENTIVNSKKCVPQFTWKINETHNRFAVTNNGNTLQITPINYNNNKKSNKPMATFPNYFHPTDENSTYCLDSFNFHWSLENEFGSEHEINSKSYPLEVHFVHYLCQYKNISAAFMAYHEAKDDHILSVVAILFNISDSDNKGIDIILSDNVLNDIRLPNTTYVHNLKLNELIPPMIQLNESGYYYYEGSSTTPPCIDIVRWNVMNVFGSVSNKQMEKFRLLMSTSNSSIAPNYRDLQYNENDVFGCISTNYPTDAGSTTIYPTIATTTNIDESSVKHSDKLTWIIVAACICIIVLGIIVFVLRKKQLRDRVGNTNQFQLQQELIPPHRIM